MAKKSWVQRNLKKAKVAAKYAELRKKHKEENNYEALSKLPKNASPCRIVNRCNLTGRKRAYYRKFGLSRLSFRELALKGELPGVTKSSW